MKITEVRSLAAPAQLLVSVRNAAEARAALRGGADWIDVKEPLRGALGPASAEAISQVVATVGGRRPVSAALGESTALLLRGCRMPELPGGLSSVKIGLSGCRQRPEWRKEVSRFAKSLSPSIRLVAVQYADWRSCDAPPPEALLDFANSYGSAFLLVDTFNKRTGRLLDHFTLDELRELFATARGLGMKCVAAGSLRQEDFGNICAAGADLVAVRGAACRSSRRTSCICEDRVAGLRKRLAAVATRFS